MYKREKDVKRNITAMRHAMFISEIPNFEGKMNLELKTQRNSMHFQSVSGKVM